MKHRSRTMVPRSRKRKGGAKRERKKIRKFEGQRISEGQAREFETLFDLCDQGKNSIRKASMMTILKALNLCFTLEELDKTIEKLTMKKPESVLRIDFPTYQKLINDFVVVKHRERENRAVFETFSIFDTKGHIDVGTTNKVTTRIGDKLTDSELKTFFEELKGDTDENGRIPSIILYNYVLSK